MEADLKKKKQLWELKKADAKASHREFNVDEPKMGELPPAIPWPKFQTKGDDVQVETVDVDEIALNLIAIRFMRESAEEGRLGAFSLPTVI